MSLQAFTDRLLRIDGVQHYIFVRGDGHILAHNVREPSALSSLIAFSGHSCDAIRPLIGTTGFHYITFSCTGRNHFYIFPVRRHFLGIIQHPDAYPPDVIEGVSRLLQNILSRKQG